LLSITGFYHRDLPHHQSPLRTASRRSLAKIPSFPLHLQASATPCPARHRVGLMVPLRKHSTTWVDAWGSGQNFDVSTGCLFFHRPSILRWMA